MRAFVLLTAVSFTVFLAGGLSYPVMSLRVRELGASYADIGLIQACFQVTSLASLYFWGSRTDRLGRRKPIALLGLAGMGVGHFLLYQADSLWILFVVRAVEGLAGSAYAVCSLTLVGDVLERRQVRGWLMAAWRSFGSLSFSLAAFLAGNVVDALGLRAPFLLAALAYAAAFLLLALIAESPPVGSASAGGSDGLPGAFPGPQDGWAVVGRFLPFLVVSFAYSLLVSAGEPLLPVYLVEQGVERTTTVRLLAVAAMAEVPSLLVGGHLADRFGRRSLIAAAFLVASLTLTFWSRVPLMPWVIGAMIAWGSAFAVFTAASMLYATEMTGRQGRGKSVSLYNTAARAGSLLGAGIGGGLGQLLGISTMLQVCSVVALLASLYALRKLPEVKAAAPGVGAEPA